MAKLKIKRAVSFVMATVLSLTAFMGVGANTAFAAAGEKTNVYMVDFPRDGDANCDGVWGYNNLTLKNGWHTGSATHTNLKAIGSFSGNVGYCIEPGVHLSMGQSMTQYDENYFNNIQANGVISGDEIRQYIGRILQYGYRGTISTSWRSQNEAAANSIAHAYATQLLIWETIVGERDANFNHKAASGCSNVKDVVNAAHPLRSKIFSYYDSMVASIQKHTVVPSFCNRSAGSAKTLELEWDGSKYTTTLTDTNNVLSNYSFSATISGVSFSTNGNKLTVSMEKAPSDAFTITASKKNSVRRGVVVWSEGKHGTGSSVQDVVSYAQEVGDPVSGYVKMKVSYGSCQIVKTSEDGKVDGINFTISGNGINQTVTTANGGKFQLDNLMPGVYTVTEQSIDKYVPQETHRVTVVAGQVATVNFNNVLKRGDLQVVKSSEDNLVEGVKFHLYGTSLADIAVDQYAVTDANGVATFKDVLISGSEPYTVEEVDTEVRYVVPENQTAAIQWKSVTKRDFSNILKKFTVTVTKSDKEEGTAQGDATLAGAVYGIYKGETLVDKYVTDANGQFTTKEYICDTDWTVREIAPSEGYLLDKTIHKVGADPKLYEVEHNLTANDVTEQVMKGNIAVIKHTDDGETKIETPEKGAEFEVYLKSSGSYDAAEEDERDTLVCDENGFAQSKDMPYGVYTVHQTKGWEGRELMSDFDVFISKDGQTYRYLINNANFESFIKDFADRHSLAVIVVHHIRKQNDSDVFNKVSGTTGLTGSADATFVLEKEKRASDTAKLYVTGRDTPYQEYTLRFRDCSWELVERKTQEQLVKETIPDVLFRLVDFMRDKEEWTGTATELLDALGETETAANVLTKWMNEYRLDFLQENHIRYEFSRRSSGRIISLVMQEGTDSDGHVDDDGVSGIPPAAVTDM